MTDRPTVIERRFTRLIARTRGVSPDTWAMLAVLSAVVLANLPYLLDLFDANPLGVRSGLFTALTPGLARGQPTTDPSDGVYSQALGHLAALDVLHLRLPWWNPYQATGTPLAGELAGGALFPPTFLTVLSNGLLYERMLLELVAGLSTYLLLRRLSVSRWAGTAAAIAFALNGTFAWFAHSAINPVPFLPLLLLGIELAYASSRGGRRGGWWLIAVAGALSFYAGFPEVAYIDALLAICWLAWRVGCLGRERLRLFAGKVATGTIVGTLLSAPLLVAFVGYANHGELGLHGSGFFASTHLVPQALPQLVLPYIYGPIFGFGDAKLMLASVWAGVGGYLSTSLLLFALIGLFSKGRRGLRIALLLWIVLALTRMYGQPPALRDLLGVLPGVSRVDFSRYAFASLELAVVILAALGLDELVRTRQSRRRVVRAALASLAVVAVAAIGARELANRLGSAFSHRPYYSGALLWGAGVVIAGAAAALVRSYSARRWLLGLLVACDAFAMFVLPELSAPRNVRTDVAPVSFLRRNLGSSRFFTLGPLQPNYGSYFGIASLNISDVVVPSAFARYVHKRLDRVANPLQLVGTYAGQYPLLSPSPQQELLRNLDGYRAAGVAYVLTPAGQTLPQSPASLQLVFRSPSTWIYRLAGATPYYTTANPTCSLLSEGRESLRLSCPGPTTLVRRETDLPGWSAQIDGRSVAIRRADDLFQAINVGAGSHRVSFSYLPPDIGWGYVAFAAGCTWLIAWAATGARRRRARSG